MLSIASPPLGTLLRSYSSAMPGTETWSLGRNFERMLGKIVRSVLPMKAIAIWVAIELGSSPPLLMLANKGIDCRICPPTVGYSVGGNLIEVLTQRGDRVGADDTGDDLNGASKSQSIEKETRPRNQALHETSRCPSLSWSCCFWDGVRTLFGKGRNL